MNLYYSQRTCSLCGKGRLFVFKNTLADCLYLHCEECQHGWEDAERWHDTASAFPASAEDFEAVPAGWHDIEDRLWQSYASLVQQE